ASRAGGGLQGRAHGTAGRPGGWLLLALPQARGGGAERRAGPVDRVVGGGPLPGALQRGAPLAARVALPARARTGGWARGVAVEGAVAAAGGPVAQPRGRVCGGPGGGRGPALRAGDGPSRRGAPGRGLCGVGGADLLANGVATCALCGAL